MAGAAAEATTSSLDELDELAQAAQPRWEQRDDPFPHWIGSNVFPRPELARLGDSFRAILARGLSEPSDPRRLSRRMAGYDAYSLTLTRLGGPLEVFQTRRWHDALQELTGVRATLDVSAALHHHKRGSDHGKVHNDLNPGHFVDNHRPDGINVNDSKLCHYQNGESYAAGKTSRQTARAVAMLFYLNNPTWREGDGGETGLYRKPRDPVLEPAAKVAPIDNTALVFECTANSFHSFLSNQQHERSSVILWLHRPLEEAIARFGREKIVFWKK